MSTQASGPDFEAGLLVNHLVYNICICEAQLQPIWIRGLHQRPKKSEALADLAGNGLCHNCEYSKEVGDWGGGVWHAMLSRYLIHEDDVELKAGFRAGLVKKA